jgi:hypothetical protein
MEEVFECGPFAFLWACCDKRATGISRAVDVERSKDCLASRVSDELAKKRGFPAQNENSNQRSPFLLKAGGTMPTSGFGIVFAQNDEGFLYVHSLVSGSPASMAKPEICVGDILSSIDSVSVYKKDLSFVAKCMNGSLKRNTVFGFCNGSIEEDGNCQIKTVVLSRRESKIMKAMKEPEIRGPERAEISPLTSMQDSDIEMPTKTKIRSSDDSENTSFEAKEVDSSADEELSMANKLRDQGSYSDAIKLYRKILKDFAANHQNNPKTLVKETDMGDKENIVPN